MSLSRQGVGNDPNYINIIPMKKYQSNANLTPNARSLRKNMTKEEKKLWYECLRLLPCAVHRQYVIGTYIVDFYCDAAKLVIELDGAQHYEDEGVKHDAERDAFLRAQGLTVLRYSNLELHQNFRGVCEDIAAHLPEE